MFVSETTRKMVLIDSIAKIKEFNAIVNQSSLDADLVSGRFTVDAKSIMGSFSLNVSEPVELRIFDKSEKAEKLIEALADFITDDEPPALDDPYEKA